MFPMKSFMGRFEEILKELDALADAVDGDGAEEFEDLNAEFEDTLMMLEELKPDGPDFAGELGEVLEDLRALAGDYRRHSAGLPEVADCARRLEMVAEMAEGSVESAN